MLSALFAYGSLEVPEVMRAVTGRSFRHRPAVLEGYRRSLLVGSSYPGILATSGERTSGIAYESLDRRTFEILDDWEGDSYRRDEVRVTLTSGQTLRAYAYVLRPECAHLISDTPWDAEAFRLSRARRSPGSR